MNISTRVIDYPIEFINIKPINPLISKCEIKVCWVGEEPNRNGSIITEEVAREMANSLPGSPIVGYYNEDKEDFESHNKIIEISNGEIKLKDTTKPYGFVDLNAKVWFAIYKDFDGVERKYLMTEGYLWTKQYPECQRILDNGNNQSMELDEKTIVASWSESNNNESRFFIINEAIISKLCILGENTEPCFEGSHITAPTIQFSFGDDFKNQLFSMMNELKDLLKEGGAKVPVRYSVSVGDNLWINLYNYLENTYPSQEENIASVYRIDGVYEENEQKFAIIQHRADGKCYRLNFSINENEEINITDTLVEITSSYSVNQEDPQFSLEDVEKFENKYFQDKVDENEQNNFEETIESQEDNGNPDEPATQEEENCSECEECTCEKESKYNLDEVVEYQELKNQFEDLQNKFELLKTEKENLENELAPLKEFCLKAKRKEKQDMINSFYMLTDEDKQDVVANIDNYSLEDIEAKLSIICVRNKVSFDLDNNEGVKNNSTVFNLDSSEDFDTPAWVKRALSVAKDLNN